LAAIVPGLAGQDGFAGCYADEGRGLDVTFDVHLAVGAHDCQSVGQVGELVEALGRWRLYGMVSHNDMAAAG